MATPVEYLTDLADETVWEFLDGISAAVPRLVTAIVFLSLSYAAIKVVLVLLRRFFRGVYPEEQDLVASLWITVIGVFLWFGAALVLLKIVGLGDVAASLGTGAGFLALGVSYALSEMIEDAVAGVYLLRDPDFNPGDRVVTGSFTGTVKAIELRKSRIELADGGTAVVANRDVEPKWTKKVDDAEAAA